jgi:hypothetical protein
VTGGGPTHKQETKATSQARNESHKPASQGAARQQAHGVPNKVAQRGDRLVVARGGRQGYVQRSFRVGRRSYATRTYYVNHVAYARAYREFRYHGVLLDVYAPVRYYPVAFYGWALNPWGLPIAYPWGWAGDPWFGYYGAYFAPWPRYAGPSFWLTDYLIASTLQMEYQARQDAGIAYAPPVDVGSVEAPAPMPEDVKEMIEAEVRRQLAEAQGEARESGEGKESVPPSLSQTGTHLLVASNDLQVHDTATGETCFIGGGDAIQMNDGLPHNGGDVNVLVRASKGSDCAVNSTVSVHLADLVEMHNSMREKIDQGLEDLRARQGTGNLPVLPTEAAGEPRFTAFAASVQPESDAAQLIGQVGTNDQNEGTVNKFPQPAPPTGPVQPTPDGREARLFATIQDGQTENQVVATLGTPRGVSFLGGVRKQYEYETGKIIFSDGEVSSVERSGESTATARTPDPGVTPQPATPGPGAGISAGLTENQVIAILGQPVRVSFLGGLKKMYEYSDRKIIFTDGSVSEVQ